MGLMRAHNVLQFQVSELKAVERSRETKKKKGTSSFKKKRVEKAKKIEPKEEKDRSSRAMFCSVQFFGRTFDGQAALRTVECFSSSSFIFSLPLPLFAPHSCFSPCSQCSFQVKGKSITTRLNGSVHLNFLSALTFFLSFSFSLLASDTPSSFSTRRPPTTYS